MHADQLQDQSTAHEASELFGNVLSVRGSQASVGLPATSLEGSDDVCVTVGKFLRIKRGNTLLIGMVTEVEVFRALGEEPSARSLVRRRQEILSLLRSALLVDDASRGHHAA